MIKRTNKLLSVIIPAYKQQGTILKDLTNIKNVLEKIRYDYEMVVVVDGCKKTYGKAKKMNGSKIKIYLLPTNQGKGYTIRYGMKKSKGDYIAFIDAGMEIDPNGISMLLEHLEWYDADIIVGSKRHLVSVVDYPLERKILSWGYFCLVWLLFLSSHVLYLGYTFATSTICHLPWTRPSEQLISHPCLISFVAVVGAGMGP